MLFNLEIILLNLSTYTLGTSRYMRSFHDCLGPMVYAGSDGIDFSVDSDQNSVASDASDEEPGVRLTTFEKVPPILMVTLENRAESDDGSYGNHDDNRYLIERTVHLGRYLQKNGDKALECYQKVDDLKRQIRELRNERAKLGCSNVSRLAKKGKRTGYSNYIFRLKTASISVTFWNIQWHILKDLVRNSLKVMAMLISHTRFAQFYPV